MHKKKILNFLRFTIATAGILCLFLALSQLTYYTVLRKPDEQKPPVPITQNVLFLSSFDSMHANYDEKTVMNNMRNHDPKSPLLIGHLRPEDTLKKAEQHSFINGQIMLDL